MLEVNLTTDDKAKTLTIQDTGVGMTRDELVENLGTIAHSGSKAFLKALGEGGAKNTNLIGQFGVGFYSAFMVAKSVKGLLPLSWRAGEPGHGFLGSSDGSGSYSVEESDGQRRGAKIVIELKDDCAEFAQDWKIKEILERYSAFVSFPINLNGKRINTVQGAVAAGRERDQGRGIHRVLEIPGACLTKSRDSACTSAPTHRSRSMPCYSSRRKTPRNSASRASSRASRSIAEKS